MKIEDYIVTTLQSHAATNLTLKKSPTEGFTDLLLELSDGRIDLCYIEEVLGIIFIQPINFSYLFQLEICSPGHIVKYWPSTPEKEKSMLLSERYSVCFPNLFLEQGSISPYLNKSDWEDCQNFFSMKKPQANVDFREIALRLKEKNVNFK